MNQGKLTEEDGRRALQDHVAERAYLARERYGDTIDYATLTTMLEDREVVRFQTNIDFDASALQPGEFAHCEPVGGKPSQGYRLIVHSAYRDRVDVLPLLIAYHLVRVNYGEIATHEEAELFGATLLGLDIDEYYATLCRLADELSDEENAV